MLKKLSASIQTIIRQDADENKQETSLSRKEPLTELVSNHLRNGIESRVLRPGDEIDFAVLARELKISRTPIRESIRKLHADGLVEFFSGGRVRVATLSASDAEAFYVVRLTLEVAAARAATIHISDYELEMLRLNVEYFGAQMKIQTRLYAIDKQFHEILYDASRNQYLSQTLKSLRIVLGLVHGPAYDQKLRINETHAEHTAILKALLSRDPENSANAVTHHIKNAKKARLGT